MRDDVMVWVDNETFGLNPHFHPILEIGIVVTDLDLNVLDHDEWLVWTRGHMEAYSKLVRDAKADDPDAQFVLDMHTKNGLIHAAESRGMDRGEVEDGIVEWLKDTQVGDVSGLPMCGSSVHFDRKFYDAQMPKVSKAFHYRIVDNSTIKELCRMYNPEVFAKLPEAKHVAPMHHRVELCLEDTINEFKFYLDNFLIDARGDSFFQLG